MTGSCREKNKSNETRYFSIPYQQQFLYFLIVYLKKEEAKNWSNRNKRRRQK